MTVTKRTVKKLWFASGNQCAHPECDQELIDFDTDTVLGIQCHIRARNSGGPRYDEEMSDEERNAYSNLILLCPTHHRMVDESPDEYPPELLDEWKQQHEHDTAEATEIPPELLEQLVAELNPTRFLVHITRADLDLLRDVVEWEPTDAFPDKKDSTGSFPIVMTFENLKDLLGRVAAPYTQTMNGNPMYKEVSDWTEDEVIAASSIAAYIAKSALQYYQVEGNRRQSEYF